MTTEAATFDDHGHEPIRIDDGVTVSDVSASAMSQRKSSIVGKFQACAVGFAVVSIATCILGPAVKYHFSKQGQLEWAETLSKGVLLPPEQKAIHQRTIDRLHQEGIKSAGPELEFQ